MTETLPSDTPDGDRSGVDSDIAIIGLALYGIAFLASSDLSTEYLPVYGGIGNGIALLSVLLVVGIVVVGLVRGRRWGWVGSIGVSVVIAGLAVYAGKLYLAVLMLAFLLALMDRGGRFDRTEIGS